MMHAFATWSDWVESGEWADGSDSAMPMLPALAADVMSLAIDPDVSVARIARVIAKDQVLATRVLRLANSAYCAPMQEVTTVNDAIVRMGTGPVRNVVLAVCFTSRLQGANVYGPQGRELMDHAIGTAYLARLVAEKLGAGRRRGVHVRAASRHGKAAAPEAGARLHQVRGADALSPGNRDRLPRTASGDRRPPAPAVAAARGAREPRAISPRSCGEHDAQSRICRHVHGEPPEPPLRLRMRQPTMRIWSRIRSARDSG